jgi:outer membrane protein assembly factor BamD
MNMHRTNYRLSALLPGLMVLLLLGGCAPAFELLDKFWGDKAESGPALLMEEGMEYYEKAYWDDAIEAFQSLKDRYPYSEFAITAELKVADALFQKKEYDEAFIAYDDFEKLHPKNKEIAYVIYQKGLCHYQQIKSIDRQQTHTLQAKEEFERLVKRFPSSEYGMRARKRIRMCLVYLAEYEIYVGNYYFKMGKYRAAIARYNAVIERYPDVGQYHQAIDNIARCKEILAREQEEETAESP